MADMGIGHDIAGSFCTREPLRHSEGKMTGCHVVQRGGAHDKHSACGNVFCHGIDDGYLSGSIHMNLNRNHAVKSRGFPLVFFTNSKPAPPVFCHSSQSGIGNLLSEMDFLEHLQSPLTDPIITH